MRMACGCALAMVLVCAGWAQEKTSPAKFVAAVGAKQTPVSADKKAEKKLTPEERTGLDLLAGSLAESRKMDAVSQGQVAWAGARIYMKYGADKTKASALLEQGFYSVLSQREESEKRLEPVRTMVESRVLKAMVPVDVAKAEELLIHAEDKSRNEAQSALVSYYLSKGNDARALELVRQMAVEHEMNYGDAMTLMSHAKPGQESLRRELFAESLASYGAHEHDDGVNPGGKNFGAMILRFHADVPGPMVSQAIVEVLSQAKKADDKMAERNGFLRAHMATSKGEATWTKRYDYQLFALLPILRAVDPVEADARIKDSTSARELLAKYENGLDDLAPSLSDPSKEKSGSNMSMSISTGYGAGQQPSTPNPEALLMMQINQELVQHPESAMAKIPQLTSSWNRVSSYMLIGQVHWKTHPAVAREGIRKGLEEADKTEPGVAGQFYVDAADIYMRMSEPESAKKALEKGTHIAAKLYEVDTNPENPNLAPVCFWPSTELWLRMVRVGTKISPLWAMELLKAAPGEDVLGMGQMVIAASLLKVDYLMGNTITIHHGSTDWSGEEQEPENTQAAELPANSRNASVMTNRIVY